MPSLGRVGTLLLLSSNTQRYNTAREAGATGGNEGGGLNLKGQRIGGSLMEGKKKPPGNNGAWIYVYIVSTHTQNREKEKR